MTRTPGWATGGIETLYPGEYEIDLTPIECQDRIPGEFLIDAVFVEARLDAKTGRLRASTPSRPMLKRGARIVERVREGEPGKLSAMREACGLPSNVTAAALNRMREEYGGSDPFAQGISAGYGYGGGVNAQYLPLWPGPVTRQLYWQDYFQMSAKAFEAYNHDPVSWRCVHMKQEFALGKGLQARVTYSGGSKAGQTHDKAQAAWDEFWKRCKMDQRLDMVIRDLSWGGEQFLRYFTKGPLTTVRSLDPASVYDIITDPEDLETVFAYHQQFQTAYQLYPPEAGTPPTGVQSPMGPTQPGATTRYIIRQILPQEIDHYRINQSAYERRGRSDLFPALGWIKRMRDYLTSHVVRADMLSRICWDLEVDGNAPTIMATRAALFPNGRPPQPGTIFGHNSASKLSAMVPVQGGSGGRWDPVLDALVTMVANAIGLPKDWLGFGMGSTRASALVATEPAARSLEDLQGTAEQILHDCFDRVMATAKITDAEAEFTFPSIATEDRTAKLEDLSFAEANGWLSKQTAASIGAKELGITGYDFEEEQMLIASEFDAAEDGSDEKPKIGPDGLPVPVKPKQGDGVVRRPMIIATNRQAPKLDVTRAVSSQEDEPPGLAVPLGSDGTPLAGAAAATAGAVPAPGGERPNPSGPGRAGLAKDENPMSGAGAANIRADNSGAGAARESEPMYSASQVSAMLVAVMREQGPDGVSGPRDGSVFERHAAAFREETRVNLRELVAAVGGSGQGTSE